MNLNIEPTITRRWPKGIDSSYWIINERLNSIWTYIKYYFHPHIHVHVLLIWPHTYMYIPVTTSVMVALSTSSVVFTTHEYCPLWPRLTLVNVSEELYCMSSSDTVLGSGRVLLAVEFHVTLTVLELLITVQVRTTVSPYIAPTSDWVLNTVRSNKRRRESKYMYSMIHDGMDSKYQAASV